MLTRGYLINSEGVLIRNADITISFGQFSDMQKMVTFPGTDNAWGAKTVLRDSIFVGMSKNTGPYSCQGGRGFPWSGLAELSDCPYDQNMLSISGAPQAGDPNSF